MSGIKDKMLFFLLQYPLSKNKLCFTKNNLTCSTFQNPYFEKS